MVQVSEEPADPGRKLGKSSPSSPGNSMSETVSTQFEIRKIYIKDASFETPHSPKVFLENWNPETKVQLHTDSRTLDNDLHEVILSLTVTATVGDKTAFLAEIKQAGVFLAKGFSGEQLGPLLGAFCPHQLYPFAREAVADLILKGGFPQMLLGPVNFDGLHALKLKQAKERAEQKDAAPKH
jgi:preprotein translocase subunit SecB